MTDYSNSIQQLLYEALASNVTLYDTPPKNAAYPYALIGQDRITDISTKTTHGERVIVEITLWDNAPGFDRIKSLAKSIHGILQDFTPTIPGACLPTVQFRSARYDFIERRRLRRAVLQFQLSVYEEN